MIEYSNLKSKVCHLLTCAQEIVLSVRMDLKHTIKIECNYKNGIKYEIIFKIINRETHKISPKKNKDPIRKLESFAEV